MIRLHVIGLPHVDTTVSNSYCAYTGKVRRFCDMMSGLGHTVYLYAGEDNDAQVKEHIVCGTAANEPANVPEFDADSPLFADFAERAIAAIAERREDRDFLCLIGGRAQKPIADAFPDMMAVEYGVGYAGVFTDYRVFESYAWMHMVYGSQGDPHACDGRFYDEVIPNYFDVSEFPFRAKTADHYLYVGRLIDRKGWRLAVEVCERLGKKLVLAGAGDPGPLPGNVEHVGVVDPVGRAALMGSAIATFVPTLYVEPFGGVHVESMLCGTPVITTDWGAFTETVTEGVGFRCRTFQEFCDAALAAPDLSRQAIRRYALANWSMEAIAPRYDAYFRRLLDLHGEGFYT